MSATLFSDELRVKVTNRQILSIALPVSLSIFIPQINLLTNSIFLGHYDEAALGNAGITGVFYLIFAVAGHGLNAGLQTVFSRYAGAGESDKFQTILAQAIRIACIFALTAIAFTQILAPVILEAVADPASYPQQMSFLRLRVFGLPFLYLFQMGNAFLVASLNSRYIIYGFVVEALTNILFDWLLIFGNAGMPAMGFNGAALASVIAEAAGFFTVLAVLYKSGLKRKYDLLLNFSFDRSFAKEILQISAPLVLQYVISVTTWLVFFFLLEGRGDIAKATSNVMRNVFGLAGIFVWAFATTSNTMVGNLMGQGRYDDVFPCIKRIMLWSVSLCAIPVLVMNLFPGQFFSLFGRDARFISEATSVVRMVSAGILFMSIANIWLNAVAGTGKTTVNLRIELVAIVFYLLYTWYFMKINYISLAMAWSNEFVYWTVVFAIAFFYMRTGNWRPKPAKLDQ